MFKMCSGRGSRLEEQYQERRRKRAQRALEARSAGEVLDLEGNESRAGGSSANVHEEDK